LGKIMEDDPHNVDSDAVDNVVAIAGIYKYNI
jgi:hypothetical protein